MKLDDGVKVMLQIIFSCLLFIGIVVFACQAMYDADKWFRGGERSLVLNVALITGAIFTLLALGTAGGSGPATAATSEIRSFLIIIFRIK